MLTLERTLLFVRFGAMWKNFSKKKSKKKQNCQHNVKKEVMYCVSEISTEVKSTEGVLIS